MSAPFFCCFELAQGVVSAAHCGVLFDASVRRCKASCNEIDELLTDLIRES
ncbi:hypothetical protein XCCB100_0297 [Xanthomonas campestris pv. campestris]|uniref:Uncharacterized protein n=1 Tax=Xanthomonas campestris pv. campestris (strain B100) TaxID=509169 RepID=B0RM41_XANCB|nr:hypothetical protein XCCB100_0297 [Xanthomonas campestris pv. campestris]